MDSIRDAGKGSSFYTYLPGIQNVHYWTSTEDNSDEAYLVAFDNSSNSYSNLKDAGVMGNGWVVCVKGNN